MRILFFILLILPFYSLAQSVYPIRADSVRIYKQGGSAELIIENITRDTIGPIYNIGKGRTRFVKVRAITDSSFVIGLDTIVIRGAQGGGSGNNNSNTGSGYRLLNAGTQELRTLYAGFGLIYDSTTNAGGLTGKVDSANLPKSIFRAGDNTSLNYAPGNPDTITISSSGSNVNKIEFVSLTENATYQSDDLIGKEILSLSIEGDEVGSIARSSAYYTFNSTTGTISLTNGLFAEDDYVLILYKGGGEEDVGSSFTPDSLENVLAWYDFTNSSSLTFSSGRVSQVNDLSGNGNHATQGTFAGMPAWSASTGGYAFFDSARNCSITKTLSSPVSGNYTVYLVIRKPSTNAFVDGGEIVTLDDAGGSQGIGERNSSFYLGNAYSSYDGSTSIAHTANALHFNNYILLRYSIMSGGKANWHVNDEPASRVGYDGPGVGSDPVIDFIKFGQRAASPTNFYLKEALVIADTVDDGVDQQVWTYMKNKHTLPSRDYIMMIGDSHTFGYQSGTPQNKPCYINLMERTGLPVYNNGISGSKAYDPAAPSTATNLNNIISTWLAQGNPDKGYVVFCYGTNDTPSDVANPAWKASYKASIQACIDAGYPTNKLIICSPYRNTNASYQPQIDAAAVIAEEIADELGIKFADIRQAMIDAGLDINTVSGGDLIHGNDPIHDVGAATIQAQL